MVVFFSVAATNKRCGLQWFPVAAADERCGLQWFPVAAADEHCGLQWFPVAAADEHCGLQWFPVAAADEHCGLQWFPVAAADERCGLQWFPVAAAASAVVCSGFLWPRRRALWFAVVSCGRGGERCGLQWFPVAAADERCGLQWFPVASNSTVKMAMFSNKTSSGGSSNLVEFKAGRCKLEAGTGPTKRKVVAEPQKGLVFIKQSADNLVHFCWKNRDSGNVVDDLIVFPGDTEFKEVKGCPDGQVFMLKFKSSEDRRLFWVQEPAIDKDIMQKVSDALNKPPPQRMAARGTANERSGGSASLANISGSEELGALSGLDQSQLMQLLQFMNPSGTGNDAALQNVLSGAADNSNSNESNNARENSLAQADSISSQLQRLLRGSGIDRTEVDLADVTTGEKVAESVKNNSEQLLPHVPESTQPLQELIDTVHSPMFRQASSTFGHALQTGQMAPVLDQFGIPEDAKNAAQKGDLLEFAKKLTEAEQKKTAESSSTTAAEDPVKEPEPKRGKTDDDSMDLD